MNKKSVAYLTILLSGTVLLSGCAQSTLTGTSYSVEKPVRHSQYKQAVLSPLCLLLLKVAPMV